MEISASEPSDDTMLAYLRAEQDHYYFDIGAYGPQLNRVNFVGVAGPWRAGKSTLIHAATQPEDIAALTLSTTRPFEEQSHPNVTTPLEVFYKAVGERSIVSYAVDTVHDHVHGTFVSGYTAPITVGEFDTRCSEQVLNAEFEDVVIPFTVMPGEEYAGRIGLDQAHSPDIIPKLDQSLDSLAFAKRNIDSRWLVPIYLSSERGELERAAEDIGKIAHQRSLATINNSEALRYITEMRTVIESLLGRIALQ